MEAGSQVPTVVGDSRGGSPRDVTAHNRSILIGGSDDGSGETGSLDQQTLVLVFLLERVCYHRDKTSALFRFIVQRLVQACFSPHSLGMRSAISMGPLVSLVRTRTPHSINYRQVGILQSDDFLHNLPALRTRFKALLFSALPENFAKFVTDVLTVKVASRGR